MTQRYMLTVTVPAENADAVRFAVGEAGGGKIGNYTFCSVTTRVAGRFKAGEGTSPVTLGIKESNDVELIEEERIEWQCTEDVIDDVLAALKKAHPYEEIAYAVWRLEDR